MIKDSVIKSIEQLLRHEGLSQRQIAKLLGVSRGTVQAVAHGRRIIMTKFPPQHSFIPPKGPPNRCPNCGAYVLMPCLACQLFGNIPPSMEA